MLESNTSSQNRPKTFKPILILIICGAISVICLIFFLCTLFAYSNPDSNPKILNAKQTAATDSSLLLSWNCLGNVDTYILHCVGSDGNDFGVTTTDIPFAAIRDLPSDSEYTVQISAYKDGKECAEKSIHCSTEPFCEITAINILNTTANSVTFSWEYNGTDNGFVAVAYVLDTDGKRHLTSTEAQISEGSSAECTINGLMPQMHYTVAVMPSTQYSSIYKSKFTTGKYNYAYTRYNILRCVICPEDSDDSDSVRKLKTIEPNSLYKISLLITGKASKTDKSDMAFLVTDSNGDLVSETQYNDIYTNPEGKVEYKSRLNMLPFVSPKEEGTYTGYFTIDGEIARTLTFDVKN